MSDVYGAFESNMKDAAALSSVFEYLTNTVSGPMSFDDLLRSRLVYALSAFDKLLHDVIRTGIVETYAGKRAATKKYLNEKICLSDLNTLSSSIPGTAEAVFENIIREKLSFISYQDPDKVADGLSYIWDEPHKWLRISEKLGLPEGDVRKRLKLISARRNAIVHEADIDPVTGHKLAISNSECHDAHNFLLAVGAAVFSLVAVSHAGQ